MVFTAVEQRVESQNLPSVLREVRPHHHVCTCFNLPKPPSRWGWTSQPKGISAQYSGLQTHKSKQFQHKLHLRCIVATTGGLVGIKAKSPSQSTQTYSNKVLYQVGAPF
jgi:hypothetical protein